MSDRLLIHPASGQLHYASRSPTGCQPVALEGFTSATIAGTNITVTKMPRHDGDLIVIADGQKSVGVFVPDEVLTAAQSFAAMFDGAIVQIDQLSGDL